MDKIIHYFTPLLEEIVEPGWERSEEEMLFEDIMDSQPEVNSERVPKRKKI
jgi:hypothetical protein